FLWVVFRPAPLTHTVPAAFVVAVTSRPLRTRLIFPILTEGFLAQPVTAMWVVCLITAPFCPVISVGLSSLVVQRLKCSFSGTLAVSAECGPAGSTVSNVVTGASGTVSKRE